MRFVEFLPGCGQKAVEITRIAQIAAPAPCPGHLCKDRHRYLTWEIKDDKYQHQLLSDLFAVVELSGAEPTTLTPQGQSKS